MSAALRPTARAALALALLLLGAGCGETDQGTDEEAGKRGPAPGRLLTLRLAKTDDSIQRAVVRLDPRGATLVVAKEPDADDLVIERESGRYRLAGEVTRNRMPVGTATASQAVALAQDAHAWSRDTLAPAARAAGIALPEGDATYWRPTAVPLEAGVVIAVRATGGATEDVRGFLFVEGVSEDGALQLRVYPRILLRSPTDGK